MCKLFPTSHRLQVRCICLAIALLVMVPLVIMADDPSFPVGRQVEVQPTMMLDPSTGPWVRAQVIANVREGIVRVRDERGDEFLMRTEGGKWIRDATPPPPSAAPSNAEPGKCTKCNAPLMAKARFCVECGTAVPQPPQAKNCPSCGTKSSGGAFCQNCGTKLLAGGAADAPAPPMPAPPAPAPAPPKETPADDETTALTNKVNELDKSGGEKMQAKDYRGAALDFLGGLDTSAKLAKMHPDMPIYQESEAYFAGRMAGALESMDDLAKALSMQERSAKGYEKVASLPDAKTETKAWAAGAFGVLSWYQLLSRDPQSAASSARKGLSFDPSQIWIKTNLAHALLFTGQLAEAINIYAAERHTKLSDQRVFQDAVLDDFDKFEKRSVTHADVAKIRALYSSPSPGMAGTGRTAPPAPPAPAPAPPGGKEKTDYGPMVKVVEAFLIMLDKGQYAESFDAADPSFREGLTKKAWSENLTQHRATLGKSTKRTLIDNVDTNTDLTSGKVTYVFRVNSTFEADTVVEEVTIVKSADGQYRVADHAITKSL
jgi:hypothetical protein